MSKLVESRHLGPLPLEADAGPRKTLIPMSPGEEVFAVDGSRDGLTNMEFEVRVAGSLNETRLRAALDAAVSKHPMARTQMASPRFLFARPVWEIADNVDAGAILEVSELDESGDIDALRARFSDLAIDLRKAPALRAMLVHRPGGDSLLLSITHSICDGIGAMRLISSIARAYAGQPDEVPSDVDPLAVRDNFRFFRDPARTIPRSKRVRGQVAVVAKDGATEASGYGIRRLAFSAEEVAQLDPKRFGTDVTLNDMLIAAAHLTVARWNAAHGESCDLVTVSVPTNLRPPAWWFEVVGNAVHLVRIATSAADRATPQALLSAIASQSRLIRDGVAYAKFQHPRWLLWMFMRLFLPVKIFQYLHMPRKRKARSSILLTNLGRMVTRICAFGHGAGEITEFWSTPPVTKEMGIAILIVVHNGRLLLSMRHRFTRLNAAAAQAFFDLFREQLEALNRAEV